MVRGAKTQLRGAISRDDLPRLNWTESELRRRRKGDPKKVRIACRLREKTNMTLKWPNALEPRGERVVFIE